jgi:hypothetical protein
MPPCLPLPCRRIDLVVYRSATVIRRERMNLWRPTAALSGVALVAANIPTFRASRVQPIEALRHS